MRSVFFYFSAVCGSFFSFFFFSQIVLAADTDIVITEIAAYEKTDHEWIEIYNKGGAPVDITGWKFFEDNINHTLSVFRGDFIIDAGEYAVIADVAANTTADYPNFTGTLIDSSWQTLNEGGESVGLKSAGGAIVEQFTYISAPDHSLERKNPSLADYSSANWQEHPSSNSIGVASFASPQTPQPSQPESPPASPAQPPQQTQGGGTDNQSAPQTSTPSSSQILSPQSPWKAARGDVVVNEFVADPTDNEKEWVELYNNSNQTIDLDKWTIQDGSKNTIQIKGILGTSGNARFLVFESKDSIFNNSGDAIILKDGNGVLIDHVSYGDWDDGMVSNNAPRAQDPSSAARFPDGYNSFNDASDFRITRKPTRRESNILIEETVQKEKDLPSSAAIIISELFPHPLQSSTSTEEYIELYNQGNELIDLTGWRFETSSGASYIIPPTPTSPVLGPQEYGVFFRSKINLALKNYGGDTVRLFQKGKDRAHMSVTYKGDALQDQSFARDSEGEYVWTEIPTPGKPNTIKRQNQPPEISFFVPQSGEVGLTITFDATDSRDADKDQLNFFWDFGDGTQGHGAYTTHLYRDIGTYAVELTLKAGEHEVKERRKLAIKGYEAHQGTLPQSLAMPPAALSAPSPSEISHPQKVILTEVFPNPRGKDTDEFIELYNEGATPVDLTGWVIETQNGKTKNFFPPVTVKPKTYFTLSQQTGFRSLRNSSDELLLIDSTGFTIDSIDYEDAPSGMSLARAENGDWIWTTTPTKGKKNLARLPQTDAGQEESTVQSTRIPMRSKTKKTNTVGSNGRLSLAHVSDAKPRTTVRVRGRITVLPGIFDSTSLYISDGKQAVLIKSQKGVFPLLSLGQEVEVKGTYSKSASGPTISVKEISDIKKIPGEPAQVQPMSLSLAGISDSTVGTLAKVEAEVTNVRWPNVYLKQGDNQIRAYIKKNTGIPKLPLTEGQKIAIAGILQKTATGYRLLPREEKDIIIISSPRVTSEGKKEIYTIPVSGPSKREYWTATLVAAIVVLGGLMIRFVRKKNSHAAHETHHSNLL